MSVIRAAAASHPTAALWKAAEWIKPSSSKLCCIGYMIPQACVFVKGVRGSKARGAHKKLQTSGKCGRIVISLGSTARSPCRESAVSTCAKPQADFVQRCLDTEVCRNVRKKQERAQCRVRAAALSQDIHGDSHLCAAVCGICGQAAHRQAHGALVGSVREHERTVRRLVPVLQGGSISCHRVRSKPVRSRRAHILRRAVQGEPPVHAQGTASRGMCGSLSAVRVHIGAVIGAQGSGTVRALHRIRGASRHILLQRDIPFRHQLHQRCADDGVFPSCAPHAHGSIGSARGI